MNIYKSLAGSMHPRRFKVFQACPQQPGTITTMMQSVILLLSGLSVIAVAAETFSDPHSTYQIGKGRPRKSCRGRAAPWISGISSNLPAQSWCSNNFPMPTVTVTLTTTETSTAPTDEATSTVSTETLTAPAQDTTSTVAIETLTITESTDTVT